MARTLPPSSRPPPTAREFLALHRSLDPPWVSGARRLVRSDDASAVLHIIPYAKPVTKDRMRLDRCGHNYEFSVKAYLRLKQFLFGTIAGSLLDGVAQTPELVGFAEHPAPVTFLLGKFQSLLI
jgi:hypothetical protein